MRFEKNVEDEYTVVKLLEDKLDSRISASLKSEFIMLSTNGVKNIIFNMEQVKYTDSSGLSAILTANRLCRDSNGTLILTNLTPTQRNLSKFLTWRLYCIFSRLKKKHGKQYICWSWKSRFRKVVIPNNLCRISNNI